jgi:hypothetical protein
MKPDFILLRCAIALAACITTLSAQTNTTIISHPRYSSGAHPTHNPDTIHNPGNRSAASILEIDGIQTKPHETASSPRDTASGS